MQRGIPAGQVAKGGSEAPCFYSRRVSAWVGMFHSYSPWPSRELVTKGERSEAYGACYLSRSFYLRFQHLVMRIYCALMVDSFASMVNHYRFAHLRFTLFYFFILLLVEAYDQILASSVTRRGPGVQPELRHTSAQDETSHSELIGPCHETLGSSGLGGESSPDLASNRVSLHFMTLQSFPPFPCLLVMLAGLEHERTRPKQALSVGIWDPI